MRIKFKFLAITMITGMVVYLVIYLMLSSQQNQIVAQNRKEKWKVSALNKSLDSMWNKHADILVQSESQKNQMKLRLKVMHQFKKRRSRVRYMCSTVEGVKNVITNVRQQTIANMVIDTRHNLTWCPIYKAASTLWMKNFAMLSGFSISKNFKDKIEIDYSTIVKQKYQHTNSRDKLNDVDKTIKFVIVRHPFERLLSAYRDKLEHIQGREFYYAHYGKHIRQKYREAHSNLTSIEPTFNEFLQFVAEEKIFDEHWIPYFDSCQPCSINYDYIFKFESLKDEYNVFIKDQNLVSYVDYMVSDRENTSSQGITNDLVAEKYFRDVPESLLLNVFEIYQLDFILFSYTPIKYYLMSKDQQ